MHDQAPVARRQFLAHSIAAGAAVSMAGRLSAAPAERSEPRLKKAVKFDMVKSGSSIEEKFALLKSLGFQGVELNSPSNIDRREAVTAARKTGIDIHGVIDSIQWTVRLSDPDPAVRARGLEGLKTALRDAKFYGATTVLLVPGKVADPEKENYEQVYERSQAQIRKAIPLAEDVGVKIAVEVVWNDFISKPEEFAAYIDAFNNPIVGGYFDISNMLKYGVASSTWIRKLGKRMLKFDFKGYSRKRGWVSIGEGDENWPEVLRALDDVGYRGWATAEVSGGGRKELADVAERMNRCLALS